jgi:hypothetical protein
MVVVVVASTLVTPQDIIRYSMKIIWLVMHVALGFRSHGEMNLAALQVIRIYGDAGLKNL